LKKSLGRLAGAALAAAALTLAAAPTAMAQDDPTTSTTAATPSGSSTTTSTTSTPTSSETPTSSSASTSETSSAADVTTTSEPGTTPGRAKAAPRAATSTPTSTTSAPPEKPYYDNVGHGYIGLTGEGVLVIACAEGAPGNVATANLTVTAGPDQDEADGRYWNYDVRIAGDAPGKTSFSWTCDGKPGQGDVDFEQAPPTGPPSTTPSTTASAPTSTTTGTTTAAPAGNQPKAQVRYAPAGGIETGFGGMAPA
jgi:hypothetical protein